MCVSAWVGGSGRGVCASVWWCVNEREKSERAREREREREGERERERERERDAEKALLFEW